ncbi:MAG: deoxyguanosinetriphosphate triphosphohydrolase [Actinobacteria bacterium]|nr:deoxyguanosinetriphosphate triphosphohydrolase [Actinomycetota bacterium]MCB9413756.1 deoxyguanosinetriphosphate triphosphohydrolase [Actinomycetota bacterium]MCB9424760.1 deoxyguanosinetriphosphate triphosphohydrolase [Actinomycetota bacterium]HRY10337.1 deoxyguanosinetriphosphate triphosphohydrolase [Candidatus Nanopelagicales bacterium]
MEYGAEAHERFVLEPPYPGRSDFARDRARVLHSAALRRLAAKTQVQMAGQDDFPRTRLTHTLEVAQISRELGSSLGADPDIVDTAGLAHDLGHPPFGHNGESALDALSADIGGFEGNAQSFRVLTRLEFKVFAERRSVGLNLTRAGLDAVIKYPWPRGSGRSKFNVYAEDLEIFDWVRDGAPAETRCFEAQIMDFADDVAYCVHDLEDAIVSGALDPQTVTAPEVARKVVRAAHDLYAIGIAEDTLMAALERVAALAIWPDQRDPSARGLAGLKNLTSSLIRRFCSAAHEATQRHYGAGPLGRFDASLVIPAGTLAEVAVLKAITYVHVMSGNESRYEWEREVINAVVAGLLAQRLPLQTPFQQAWEATGDPDVRLRIVIDQVASLTDLSIMRWQRDLAGG